MKPFAILAGTLLSCALMLSSCRSGQTHGETDYVLSKNYPLVCAVSNLAPKNLETLAAALHSRTSAAGNPDFLDSVKFSYSEIETIGEALAASDDKDFPNLISRLRANGAYHIYEDLQDPDFIKAAVRQDLEGMNRAIRVYGQAETPHYAGIDSISFDVKSSHYLNLMEDLRTTSLRQCQGRTDELFALPLAIVRNLLEVNEREDAARYEPLSETENAPAVREAASTDWDKYPYTVIIVPGSGPREEGQPLSPTGKQRSKYASLLYKEGKAPFLMVSGGSVHPRLTPYNEAFEMRRYLVNECGVPAANIFIEPHARHTTTNLRNCVRIMKNAGFPMDRKGLISSSQFQLNYICKPKFSSLCKKMMLVVPIEIGGRIGDRELEFLPLECATQVCPVDPMDP